MEIQGLIEKFTNLLYDGNKNLWKGGYPVDDKEAVYRLMENILEDEEIALLDIPQIDLYIDQITTLIDSKLSGMCRTPNDKLLTKAMVNNYSKEKLISPTKGKKYCREQMLRILMICYLKQVLSIQDVKRILSTFEGEEEAQHMYKLLLEEKREVAGRILADSKQHIEASETLKPADVVTLILHLALLSSYAKRASEALIDNLFPIDDKE